MPTRAWIRRLQAAFRRHSYRPTRRRRRAPQSGAWRQSASVAMAAEFLEDRVLLTQTLFVDFGFDFPSGGLPVTNDLSDDVNGPEKFTGDGPDLISLASSISNLGIDFFPGVGGVGDQTDANGFASAVMTTLTRIFEPFDVDIRMADAASFGEISATLFPGEDGDAYIVAAGSSATGVEGGTNTWGWAKVDDGNDDDNTGFVFSDTILVAGTTRGFSIQAMVDTVASVIAHEAGHTFGLEHTQDDVPRTAGDVMRTTTWFDQGIELFSRMGHPLEDPPLIGSDQQNAYTILGDPDVLGLSSARAYVTGSGRPDAISLVSTGTNTAQVTVTDVETGAQYANYSINTSAGITIEAGLGDDRIVINPGINDPIEVRGGLGSDTLIIADFTTTGEITYHVRDDQINSTAGRVVEYDPDELEQIDIQANWYASNFDIHSFAAGNTLNIFADRGMPNDPLYGINRVRLAPRAVDRNLSAVKGDIHYESRNNQDTVELFDQNETQNFDYSISSGSLIDPRSVTIERASGGSYHFANSSKVSIYSGSGHSEFDVDSVGSRVRLDIFAGGGNDKLRLSPHDHRAGDFISGLNPPIHFRGEDGDNWIEIFDQDSNSEGTFRYGSFVGQSPSIHHTSESSSGYLVTYEDIDRITHNADFSAETFDIDLVPLGTSLKINKFFENFNVADTFKIGGGDFAANIRGSVTIDGGGGDDLLFIEDADNFAGMRDLGDDAPFGTNPIIGNRDVYTFDTSPIYGNPTFVKREEDQGPTGTFFFETPTLTFISIATARLEASDTDGEQIPDTRIFVNETEPGTRLILDGNNGVEEFRVNAAGLSSDVVINGGNPTSSPGDSLRIVGTPSLRATYAPHQIVDNAGTVSINSRTVSFGGLDRAMMENFDFVAFESPRSFDNVHVVPEEDGWSRIAGTSGHPSLPLPFQSLSFRDVGTFTLDVALHDGEPFVYPLGPAGTTWAGVPDDIVTIHPAALDARGLERFQVNTGRGENIVHDHTMVTGPQAPVLLAVGGRNGSTHVIAYGEAPQLDFEQLNSQLTTLTAKDDDGEQFYRILTLDVMTVTMAEPQPLVRAIAENQELTIDAAGGLQQIQGAVTTFQVAPDPSGSELVAVLLGDSTLNQGQIVFEKFTIQGTRPESGAPGMTPNAAPQGLSVGPLNAGPQPEPPATPDNITVRPLFAGPQPEPPSSPIEVIGYGAEDSVTFLGGAVDGDVHSTAFDINVVNLETSSFVNIELLVRPVDPLAEVGFTIVPPVDGNGPQIGLAGHNLPGDVANVSMTTDPLGLLDPGQFIELLVRGIRDLRMQGSLHDELFSVTPETDGGRESRLRQMSSDGTVSIELLVTTDPDAQVFAYEGLGGVDRFDIQYPEPDFQPTTTDLKGMQTVSLRPTASDPLATGLVRQTLTPTRGTFETGNLLLTHDSALTTSFVESSSVDVLVTRDPASGSFDRSLSLNYAYLGSEGKYVVKDVTFEEDVEVNVAHKDGATNTTTIQQKDVVYEKNLAVKVTGADDGDDLVLVTKAGVETQESSTTEIDLKGGDDLAVITETGSGQAEGTKDEVLVKGSGDGGTTVEKKAVLYHKQKGATSGAQIDDLKLEKPEYAVKIEAVKSKADQSLLTESGMAKVESGEITVDYKGDASKIDLFIKNADVKPVLAKVENPDGVTKVAKDGNVILSTPELDGTGIDPTQPFATFVVTNTLDAGVGSLRAAIDASNAWTGEGMAVITYRIPATDPGFVDVDAHLPGGDADPDTFVISPLSALPALTRGQTVINGQSQHSLTGDTNPFGPEVSLAGHLAGADAIGLQLASSDNTVHGLNIQLFSGDGVLVSSDANTLTGNYIGTNATGNVAAGNGGAGIRIEDSSDNLIGGADALARNVISGNFRGVSMTGPTSTGNQLVGNYIGVGADGTNAIGNSADGVLVWQGATGNRIGGPQPGQRNVIAANAQNNISLGSTGTVVRGNYIGTDWTGTALPMLSTGPVRGRVGIRVGDDVNSMIGGAEPGAGNVIAGHIWGVYLSGRYLEGGAQGTRIQGNLIGTTADGRSGLANIWGVYVDGFVDSNGEVREVTDVLIGGTEAGAGNLISGHQNSGVHVFGVGATNITIQGNRIGTDIDGSDVLPNGTGVLIDGASGVQVGGADEAARNIISGNSTYGIAIQRGADNVVEGNFIGTDVSGTLDLGNAVAGVLLQDTTGNTLRGNVISGNNDNGVFVVGSTSATDMTNLIEGNFIGTDATGTSDLGNTLMGVRILRGTGTIVRGNVISGNDNSNVLVDAGGNDLLIESNLIGTDLTGNASLLNPNGLPGFGVTLVGHDNLVIGNVISANPRDGVVIDALDSSDGRGSGNVLQGNLIGLGLDGVTPLPNAGNGVRIWRGAHDNTIGSNGDGVNDKAEGNTIAHNTAAGVAVIDAGSTGNSIRGNSIHSNGGLGIDLGTAGPTANDELDADSGPNQLQNAPELSSVKPGAETKLVGKLKSTPNSTFVIDFYAGSSADPSGFGEGTRWLGSVQVVANSEGTASFNVTLPTATVLGEWVTATATDDRENTSEFSAALEIQGGGGGNPHRPNQTTFTLGDESANTSLIKTKLNRPVAIDTPAKNSEQYATMREEGAENWLQMPSGSY